MKNKVCGCAPITPSRTTHRTPLPQVGVSRSLRDTINALMVPIPGGIFEMGTRKSRYADDLDSPPRRVKLSGFNIGRTTVTNEVFAAFVAETSYRTTAEIEGWSYVFYQFVPETSLTRGFAQHTPWWCGVEGACWSSPEGPGSDITARGRHPVTHISWHDAVAFCEYTGTRLPTEAEWEYAARGGLKRKRLPWGNALVPGSGHAQNVWQGNFPDENLAEDGYVGTAPADSYDPNNFGLYAMTGNVWEWCADAFGPLPHGTQGSPAVNPLSQVDGPGKIIRGGSYLCHASYCERYFVHSRTWNMPDSSTGHTGFRIAS
ncbi:formylglycine-generating enzyme family protein [Ruegeria arenilitoris]|uniref:formylglycine-generating enzyme family protein n=1 Tax=Ruegeria arenilitoris TaxID=1173585 RepID=UPI00147E2AA7|nr:formylglycine-generating enzyme family protein [Ruegeria arenilitoris]